MVVTGIGLGVTLPTFNIVMQSAFGQDKMGVVTASTQLFRSVGGSAGVALFGGILNSNLVSHFGTLKSDPFVAMSEHITGKPFFLSADTLQQVISLPGQEAMRNSLALLPSDTAWEAIKAFDHFAGVLRVAFSDSLSAMYLSGAMIAVIACVLVFALPEIPLRKTKRTSLEEAGVELEQEFGMSDAKHEPM